MEDTGGEVMEGGRDGMDGMDGMVKRAERGKRAEGVPVPVM
jgi:hypothetical protein